MNSRQKWSNFRLSRARYLDLGSGHTAYHYASLIDLYLHSLPNFIEIGGKIFFENHNCRYCQLQSHVTQKLGQNQKSGPDKL